MLHHAAHSSSLRLTAPPPRDWGQRRTREFARKRRKHVSFPTQHIQNIFFFTWLSRDTSMKRQTVFQTNAQCLARWKKKSINANDSPPLKKIHKSTSNYQDDDANLFIYERIKTPLSELQLSIQLKGTDSWHPQDNKWSSAISVKFQESKLKLRELDLN